ncbi:hypothetical protein [Pontiella sp.]|uniref:hypothetical protein n=1 Tax=Pontiella sp. TaxID=2837462 RepID=UPI003565608C
MRNHQPSYNSLGGCLEAYFGDRRTKASAKEYREPEQGFRTIPFQSLPLTVNYMRRRPGKSPARRLFG